MVFSGAAGFWVSSAIAAKEKLNRTLTEHRNTIHETLEVLDQTPASSLDKVSWNEVIKMADQVSKEATIVGMLWAGERSEVKELEENVAAYFNMLQGFLLLSHGSKVGAGPTEGSLLSSCIHTCVKQVVDCSFMLFKESVSLYGSGNEDQKTHNPSISRQGMGCVFCCDKDDAVVTGSGSRRWHKLVVVEADVTPRLAEAVAVDGGQR